MASKESQSFPVRGSRLRVKVVVVNIKSTRVAIHLGSYSSQLLMLLHILIGSNCPGISGTVPDLLTLSLVPDGSIFCPGSDARQRDMYSARV